MVVSMSEGVFAAWRIDRGPARRLRVDDAAQLLRLKRRRFSAYERDCGRKARESRRRSARPDGDNKLPTAVRELTMTIVEERYADFGPTLAAESSRTTRASSRADLREWIVEDGCRRTAAVAYPRFISRGVGASVSASSCRSAAAALLVREPRPRGHADRLHRRRVGRIRHAASCRRSRPSTTCARRGLVERFGRPIAFSDSMRSSSEHRTAAGGDGMTQFGRPLDELDIDIICANSPQAKGRVERSSGRCQTVW